MKAMLKLIRGAGSVLHKNQPQNLSALIALLASPSYGPL